MDNFQLVVGSKECPIKTVVSIIRPSTQISNEWPTFAMELNVGSEDIRRLRQELLLKQITNMEVIYHVLELWVGKNASTATLDKLVNVVEEQCGANDVGESLRLRFSLPCKAADGNPSIDWKTIPSPFQKRITETFQKFFPTLNHLETLPSLKGPFLIKLMTGKKPPLFVHPFPDTQRYYINRTLITRNIISKKIFEQNSEDIFLFTGMDISELSALTGNMLTGSSSEQLRYSLSVKFMILDRTYHFETICEKSNYPVHLLRMEDDRRLRWISSKGRMSNLQKYVDQLQDEFDEAAFCRHLNSQPTSVLICDSPGMGKSVLLAQIGSTLSQLYPDRTVLFIGLTEFMKLIKSIEMEDEMKKIEIALQKLTGEPNINLKQIAVSIELLLDGFDELDSADYKLAHEILKNISISFKSTRLWVTSRPHLMEELETSLNFLGFNIRRFNEQDQIKFLSTFWSRKEQLDSERSEIFALKCLKSLKSKMGSRSQDIAGIPLQCLLIGEVYEKDALEYARVGNSNESGPPIGIEIEIGTITNLYQRLIEKKIEKYESLNAKLSEAKLMAIHAQLGLKLLFPGKMETLKLRSIPDENDIAESLKVGIIVKSSSMESSCAFLHRTFAEYFVAWFVVDKLRREGKWTEEINYFFLYCILDIGRYGYFESFEGNYIFESPKFSEPVICYFINSFIADPRAGNYSALCTQLNRESAELMNTIAHACANDNLVHIFNLFYELYEFDETYTRAIFTEDFLLLSIEYSSLELVKPIVSQLEQDDKLCMELQAEALRNAVRLGKFSIVEFLIKEKQLCGIVKDLSYGTWRLVYDCIKESVKCSDEEIENKIQVLRMLIRINASLLDSKVDGRAPLLFDNVHVKLLIELVKLGADVHAEQENYTVLHFTLGRILSSSDYQSLLMTIPTYSLRKLVHSKAGWKQHTPLTSALKWIDPAPETLDMFHRIGANFKYITGSSLLEFAIINGRSAVTIRKIIQHGDIKVLGQTKTVPNMQPPYLGSNLLHTAAEWGNVEAVEMLVDEYEIDVNSKNEHGRTPLDLVIQSNNDGDRFKTGLALKERGGRFKDDNSLIVAATKRNFQSVRLLISLGVDINGRDEQENTALHKYLEPKNKNYIHKFAMVQLFVDNSADLTALNNIGNTPFHTAMKNENLNIKIFQLLKSKTDETSSWTPSLCSLAITFAIRRYYYELDEEEFISILNNFCNIHHVNVCLDDYVGNFAVHVAANQGHLRCLQLLVEKGADLNVKNNLGNTPLHVAFNKRYRKIAQLLVEKGANLNVKNDLGNTPLHVAINNVYLEFVQLLVQKGADLNVKNNLGNTPLHVVVSCKPELYTLLTMVKWLIENGADVYTKNNDDHTILHQYILTTPSPSAFHSIVKYLIEADLINLFNIPGGCCMENGYNCGALPLQLAVYKLEPEIETLELLQSNKINFNAVDELGHSILFNALSGHRSLKFISTLINQFKVDWKIIDRHGCSILHHAVEDEESDYLKFFLELGGLNVNEVNDRGETPLFCAASDKKNVFKKCKLLVDYGADANISNKAELTPLDLIKRGPSRVDKCDLVNLLSTSQHLKQ